MPAEKRLFTMTAMIFSGIDITRYIHITIVPRVIEGSRMSQYRCYRDTIGRLSHKDGQ